MVRKFALIWETLGGSILMFGVITGAAAFTGCSVSTGGPQEAPTTAPTVDLPDASSIAGVDVTTSQSSYQRGQRILVTIHNSRSSLIYALPVDATGCSVIELQGKEDDQWVTEESCVAGDSTLPLSTTSIASNSQVSGWIASSVQDTAGPGPTVGGPATPGVFEGDVRDLPTVEPWEPGDPVQEVPRLSNFDSTYKKLGSGTYRIAFPFTADPTSDLVQTVYSKEFEVID